MAYSRSGGLLRAGRNLRKLVRWLGRRATDPVTETIMKAIHLDSSNFDSTLAATDLPVLVDFHAEWCGPCKMLGPIVEQIAVAKEGEAVVAKVDIDAARDLAMRYRITSVPTVIVFKDGEPVVGARGVQTKAALESMIAEAAAKTAA